MIPSSNNSNQPTLFFILGRERSGTTLLRQLLNNHSDIHIPTESAFIMHLYQKYSVKRSIDIDEFISDLQQEPYIYSWHINYAILRQNLSALKNKNFQNCCLAVLRYGGYNQAFIGDKNPIYSLFGKELHRVFPKAKFIWMIRDYRAQVNSMLKVNFEKKIVSSLSYRWVRFNKSIERLQALIPNQVLLMRYEDLVSFPERELKNLCSFLGCTYSSSLLNQPHKNNEALQQHHLSLNESINTKHLKEWEKDLTQKQLEMIEAVVGSYGEKFSYRKTTKTISRLVIKNSFGILYGVFYIYFVRRLYALPFALRLWISRKIIYKKFTFWKEVEAAKKYNPS